MKITDLKCAVIGGYPVVRVVTDEGISGYGEIEGSKPYVKPQVLFYRDLILGQDPTDVERVMLGIRRLGSFKPWGSAVSAIEMALWDIAGKAAGIPVYKLLGGKFRDKIRLYADLHAGDTDEPSAYAEKALEVVQGEGYSAVKFDVDHSGVGKLDPVNWTAGAQEMTHIIDLIQGVRAAIGSRLTWRSTATAPSTCPRRSGWAAASRGSAKPTSSGKAGCGYHTR